MWLFKALKKRGPLAQPPNASPRVLVACPDYSAPAGGVRQLYRLVAGLREELKLDAYVYHHKTGFRQSWFESLEPMLYEDATAPGANDILVVPEVWGCAIMNYPGVRKVIFNQNAYYTFMNGYELQEKIHKDPLLGNKGTPYILMSTDNSTTNFFDNAAKSVQGYFNKPVDIDDYKALITNLLSYWKKNLLPS